MAFMKRKFFKAKLLLNNRENLVWVLNMVNYWLCVTNRENWEVVQKRRIWGVPERSSRQIERVKVGDYLVFYMMPKKIAGIMEATSEAFRSDNKIFNWKGPSGDETFQHRIKLKPVTVPKQPLDFEGLIPKLNFISNKDFWTGHLRRAMRTIPKEDYETIHAFLEGN